MDWRRPGRAHAAAPLLVLALLAFAGPAEAREPGASAQALGMGDAVRSTSLGPAALYFNPAGLARARMYAVETGYDYINATKGHAFHAAISDSKMNEYVAAGLSYSYLYAEDGALGKAGHTIRFALASGYRGPNVSALIGAGVRWTKFDRKPVPDFEGVSADVGAVLDILNAVQIGVAGYNLVTVDDDLPDDSGFLPEMPISLGLGISFNYSGFVLGFDTVLDFVTREDPTPIYSIGSEYFILGLIAVRAGFEIDQVREDKSVTFGLGYVSQFWGLDLSSKVSVDDDDDAMVLAHLRIFLP